MDALSGLVGLLLFLVAVPVVVFGVAAIVGFDWRRRSDFGLRPAGPPPLRLVVGFALALVMAAALWWLLAAETAG